MAYQSLKRVFGETSLERKCRFLFGSCLLLLIAGAFIWVDQIAEQLVNGTLRQQLENTRQRGRAFAVMKMLKVHFVAWAASSDTNQDAQREDQKLLVEEIIRGLEYENYTAEILGFDENPKLGIRKPQAAWEQEIMRQLLAELQTVRPDPRDLPAGSDATTSAAAPAGAPAPAADATPPRLADFLPEDGHDRVFREQLVAQPEQSAYEYHFFQPVYYKESCTRGCHVPLHGAGAVSAGTEGSQLNRLFEPFRVVKIVLPYRQSKAAIHWIRAILSAAGIITFFVAMVAMYVIVRYVVVSPLKHLRDVSDAISRGNLDLRAEIHTNDEFEELAASFNRMLRHLTETQANLQQVNSDLDAKVDELAQLNMRLYEMNRVKSEFLANMSHELRTPLNSIIGFSEVLQGIDALNDKQKRYAQNIQKSGRALLDMINDILDVAKIEAGKMDVRSTEFRIEAVVHGQCDMVRALTEVKNIDLAVTVEPDLPPMYQDQGKVQQILTNLLSNAIKFTPEGGRVAVAAEREPSGQLLLTVSDTGVGIAEEDREIIFEKFRQSSSVVGEDGLTREYSGTGLGLSIVKELCKLLRGEIDFESELGQGSTFRVRLPWTHDNLPPTLATGGAAADLTSESASAVRA